MSKSGPIIQSETPIVVGEIKVTASVELANEVRKELEIPDPEKSVGMSIIGGEGVKDESKNNS